MDLPPELRALVYTSALQNYIHEIETATHPSATLTYKLPNDGLLALLNIRSLRFEISEAMCLAARAHHSRHEAIRADMARRLTATPHLLDEEVAEYDNMHRRLYMVNEIRSVIDRAYADVKRERRALLRASNVWMKRRDSTWEDAEGTYVR